jgi:hypothetical protein
MRPWIPCRGQGRKEGGREREGEGKEKKKRNLNPYGAGVRRWACGRSLVH